MPKRQMEIGTNAVWKGVNSLATASGEAILTQAFPEEAEKIRQYSAELLEMFAPNTGTLTTLNEAERMNEEKRISAGEVDNSLYELDDSKRTVRYASAEAYQTANNKLKEYTDYLKGLMNTDKGREFREKHPACASFVDYHVKNFDDFVAGKDVYTEITKVPGGEWFNNNGVDYLGTMEILGKKVERDLDGYESALQDLHFPQISNIIRKQQEIQDKLENSNLTLEERNELVNEQKDLNKKTIEEYDQISTKDNAQKLKDFFQNVDSTLTGERGAKIMKQQAERRLKALDQGWDPEYAQEAQPLEKISRECAITYETLARDKKLDPKLAELKEKARRVADLDPSNKFFHTQAEFVEYCQAYSDALKEYNAENRKPDVFNALAGKDFPTGASAKNFQSTSTKRDDRKRTAVYDHYVDLLNFKARGITAEDGKLVYDQQKLNELEEAYSEISKIGHDSHEKLNELFTQMKEVTPDLEKYTLSDIGEKIRLTDKDVLCYDDIENDLMEVSSTADGFIKVNAGDPQGTEIAKQMKEYADQQLADLQAQKKPDLNVYRSATYQSADMQAQMEHSKNFVENSNQMKPRMDIDVTFINGVYLTIMPKSNTAEYGGTDYIKDVEEEVAAVGKIITPAAQMHKLGKDYYNYGVSANEQHRFTINNYTNKQAFEQTMKDYDEAYNKLLSTANMKKMPAVSAMLKVDHSIVKSAMNGEDKYKYFRMIPDHFQVFGQPDIISVDPSGKRYSTAEFDEMFNEMGFSKITKSIDHSYELTKELDGAYLTDEQRKEYTKQITANNQYRLDIYNRMPSAENEQKYRKFFKDSGGGGWDHNIKGERGTVRLLLPPLMDQNKALENGWDVTRINELRPLSVDQDKCKDLHEDCIKSKDPKLLKLGALTGIIVDLDPKKQVFHNQAEFDAYYMQIARTYKAINEELSRPEVYEACPSPEHAKIMLAHSRDNAAMCDLSKMDLSKYPPDKATEKKQEVKKATELADVKLTRDMIKAVARQASEKLRHMEEKLDGQRKENSKYYRDMKTALIKVANFEDSDCTLSDFKGALNVLKGEADIYKEKRGGRFKTKDGQERLDFADDLSVFADSSLSNVESVSNSLTFGDHIRSFENIEYRLKTNLDIQSGIEEYAKAQAHTEAIDNYTETANKAIGNIKKYIDFFKEDYRTRMTTSDEYDDIVKLSEFFDKENVVEENSPEELAGKMGELSAALDVYNEKHSGSIFTSKREKQAKEYASQVQKDFDEICKSMNGMPFNEQNEKLSDLRQRWEAEKEARMTQVRADAAEHDRKLAEQKQMDNSYTLAQAKEDHIAKMNAPGHTTESLRDILKTSAAIQYMINDKRYGKDYPFDKDITELNAVQMLDSAVYNSMVSDMSDEQLINAIKDPEKFYNEYKENAESIRQNDNEIEAEKQARERKLSDPNSVIPPSDPDFSREHFKRQAYLNGYSKDIDEKSLDAIYDAFEGAGDAQEYEISADLCDLMSHMMYYDSNVDIEQRRAESLAKAHDILAPVNEGGLDLDSSFEEEVGLDPKYAEAIYGCIYANNERLVAEATKDMLSFDDWAKKYPQSDRDFRDKNYDIPSKDIMKFEKEEMDPIWEGLGKISSNASGAGIDEIPDITKELRENIVAPDEITDENDRAEREANWNEKVKGGLYKLKNLLEEGDNFARIMENAAQNKNSYDGRNSQKWIVDGLGKLNEHLNAGFDVAGLQKKYEDYKLAKENAAKQEEQKVNEEPKIEEAQEFVAPEAPERSEQTLDQAIQGQIDAIEKDDGPEVLREVLAVLTAFESEKELYGGDKKFDYDVHQAAVSQVEEDPVFNKMLADIPDDKLYEVFENHEKFYQDYKNAAAENEMQQEQPVAPVDEGMEFDGTENINAQAENAYNYDDELDDLAQFEQQKADFADLAANVYLTNKFNESIDEFMKKNPDLTPNQKQHVLSTVSLENYVASSKQEVMEHQGFKRFIDGISDQQQLDKLTDMAKRDGGKELYEFLQPPKAPEMEQPQVKQEQPVKENNAQKGGMGL